MRIQFYNYLFIINYFLINFLKDAKKDAKAGGGAAAP
jgi:hypothetical protein